MDGDAKPGEVSTTSPVVKLCGKCGVRPRRNGARGYCRECTKEWRERRKLRPDYDVQKTGPRRRVQRNGRKSPALTSGASCPVCGGTEKLLRTGRCVECHARSQEEYGSVQLTKLYPAYVVALEQAVARGTLTPKKRREFLIKYGKNCTATASIALRRPDGRPGWIAFPLASEVFGVDTSLDKRLDAEGLDVDPVLGAELAKLSKWDQPKFLEMYRADRDDALEWAALPAWQRPIRKGDADDVLIWKYFTVYRMEAEALARGTSPWPLQAQATARICPTMGVLRRMSHAGVHRLCDVIQTYGAMLGNRQNVGDVTRPPKRVQQALDQDRMGR